mmetsp:Transcript_16570/g.36803  ORF Transcript_16570/g.36803 Transcript_16570/m.36803 type:complete len:97 (-) Transcript_16570:110-400(-)
MSSSLSSSSTRTSVMPLAFIKSTHSTTVAAGMMASSDGGSPPGRSEVNRTEITARCWAKVMQRVGISRRSGTGTSSNRLVCMLRHGNCVHGSRTDC